MSILERYLANAMRYGGQFKMGLTGLHGDGPLHLYIYRSLLGLLTFLNFFVSDVFMKSNLCCVIRARLFQLFD